MNVKVICLASISEFTKEMCITQYYLVQPKVTDISLPYFCIKKNEIFSLQVFVL